MVIISRNPVRAALFLVLAFVNAAVLWMMVQAEFLSLVLIFVYVGAVMTLFLFVVMMLNIDLSAIREKFVRYIPFAAIVMLLLVALLIIALSPEHFKLAKQALPIKGPDYSNVTAMGNLLYTGYLYPFEIAAAILLVAIISAIALAFHGRKSGTKAQRVYDQLKANKRDRLRVVKMKAEKS
jgi:NADH-quinone oxidoreductase subunit J